MSRCCLHLGCVLAHPKPILYLIALETVRKTIVEIKESKEPSLKKIKSENPEQEWNNYLQQFVIEHLNQEHYSAIPWEQFRLKLHEHLQNCQLYYQQRCQSDSEDVISKCQMLAYEGALLSVSGDDRLAIAKFKEAVELRPENVRCAVYNFFPHYWLVATYHRQGNFAAIIEHVNRCGLKNIAPVQEYCTPLYGHLARFDVDQQQKHLLHLAQTGYFQSEVLFFYTLACKKLSQNCDAELKKMHLTRGNHCFQNHDVVLALYHYGLGLKRFPNDASMLLGAVHANIVAGNFSMVYDTLMPHILKICTGHEYSSLLVTVSNLCLQLGKVSQARAYLSNQKALPLSIHDAMNIFTLQVALALQDDQLCWLAIEPIMNDLSQYLKIQHVEALDKAQFMDTWTRGVLQCLNRFIRIDDHTSSIKLLQFYLDHALRIVSELEQCLGEGQPQQRQFPNRCFDRFYLNVLQSILKLYTWFPDIDSLHPAQLIRSKIQEQVKQIPAKLKAYRVPVNDNPFVSGVANDLKSLLQLSELCVLTKGGDYGVSQYLREDVLKDVGVSDGLILPELPSDENETQDIEKLPENLTLFDVYTHHYAYLVSLLLPKKNIFRNTTLGQQFQRFIDSKQLAAQFAVGVWFAEEQHSLLENMVLIDQLLDDGDHVQSVRVAGILCQSMNQFREKMSAVQQSLQGQSVNQQVVAFFNDQLRHIGQSFCYRLIYDVNRIISSTLDAGMLKQASELVDAQKAAAFIESFCNDRTFAHDDHSVIMTMKLRAALKHFAELKERLFTLQNSRLENQLALTQSSSATHPLDVFYQYNDQEYRVPFPAHMVCNPIKITQDQVNTGKNLSAHVLTIVYSQPANSPTGLPTFGHLHLALGFTTDQRIIINGFYEAQQFQANLEQNILQRLGRGHALVTQHRTEYADDPCRVMAPGKEPINFSALHHRHSEQHYYACLSQFDQPLLLQQIHKLPGGERFRPGVTVHMMALDMASIRTSCHSCRLSAMAVQNHPQEFVARFSQFLREQGFLLTQQVLRTITRVVASKGNGLDDAHLVHQNPSSNRVDEAHNFAFFQITRADVFVSGSSYFAFRK